MLYSCWVKFKFWRMSTYWRNGEQRKNSTMFEPFWPLRVGKWGIVKYVHLKSITPNIMTINLYNNNMKEIESNDYGRSEALITTCLYTLRGKTSMYRNVMKYISAFGNILGLQCKLSKIKVIPIGWTRMINYALTLWDECLIYHI